jgi:hypothetical protein
MRLTQVSRQPFVGIDLPGQELGLAPFPLARPVFRGLAEHQFVELILPWLAPLGEPTPQRHTGAGRARYEPLLLIDNVTLDKAHDLASAHHSGPCAKRRLPYRPQKIDLQFNGRKSLAVSKRTTICHTHRCICDVAQHATVERSHGVRVTLGGFKLNRCSTN